VTPDGSLCPTAPPADQCTVMWQVTRQATRLASGEGVPHPRASAVFMKAHRAPPVPMSPHCTPPPPRPRASPSPPAPLTVVPGEGKPITLGDDFLALIDEAQEWEAPPSAHAPLSPPLGVPQLPGGR
jgi:hypothetical protein